MKTLQLQLDYLAGPVWKDVWDTKQNAEVTGILIVDSDEEVAALNDEIQSLYSSYYEFDSHDQACWFNEEQQKADKEKMLGLLSRLTARLDKINDGTFVVDDKLTSFYSSL